MLGFSHIFGVNPRIVRQLTVFVPTRDANQQPVDYNKWTMLTLDFLTETFEKATLVSPGMGLWKEETSADVEVEAIYLIQAYMPDEDLEMKLGDLKQFLVRMGHSLNQKAIGFLINDQYYELPVI
ncbi:hypothetical protein K2Y11_04430 [bacterium]|nr:hypothetical protein [bacterium]